LADKELEASHANVTKTFIDLRNIVNAISHLPLKEQLVQLTTRDITYTGRVKAVNLADRRVTLVIEDGVTVVIPFHALSMPETAKTRKAHEE